LMQYKNLLAGDGEIFFKTDDPKLFSFSLGEFEHTGFILSNMTTDLHAGEGNDDNIRTEFEQKFADQGVMICRVEARKEDSFAK
jgi:tRNA (guanine-N7-)-methyltransferase